MYENAQSNMLPEELSQFIHTINQKHEKDEMSADLRNIFMFQTEDMDGNITDTKFAMNLMTDVGTISDTSRGGQFRLCYAENYVPAYDKAYIQSTGDNTGWLDMNNAYTYYPMTFDSDTGMISQRYCDFSYTCDYNISGWNTDKTFNIIAMQWSYETFNSIGAIANIVDSHGDPSIITKKLNERLTVYGFRSTSMHESVITRAWDNGIYLAITPINCVISYYNRYYPLSSINFQLQNGITDQSYYYYSNSSSDNYRTYTNYHYFNNHTSYDNDTPYPINSNLHSNYGRNLSDNLTVEDHRLFWSQASWYTKGDIHQNMCAFYFIHTNTPDEITTNNRLNLVYTDYDTTGTIGNAFGKYAVDTTYQRGVVPVTDFNMTDSKMFNYQTKAWDIQDTFVNEPDAWYDETLIGWCKSLYIKDPDNISQEYYVYINAHPDIPITKLNYDSRAKVYLADKYWDTSTWTRILSGTIPAELQSKKYYITNNSYYVPYPVTRQQNVHSITPSHARYKIASTPEFPQNTNNYWMRVKPIASDTYKFILSYKHLMFIDNGVCDASFELVGDSDNWDIDAYQFRYLFGSNLLVAPQSNRHLNYNISHGGIPYNVRVYDVSNYGVQPTYTDLPIPTDVCDQLKKGYYSKSENGYIGMWESGNNKAALIDMNQFAIDPTTCVKQFDDVLYFHVQEFTNYAIYFIAGSSPARLVVYDLSTDSVLQTCDYNGEYGNQIWGIIGASDYVYIRVYSTTDSEWRTLLYRISTNSYEWMLNNDLYFRQKYNEAAYDDSNDKLRHDVTALSIVYHRDGFVLTRDTGYNNSSDGYPGGTNTEIQYVTFDTPKTVRKLFYSSRTYVPGRNTSPGNTSSYGGPESWYFENENGTFVSGAQIVETPAHQLLLVGVFGRYHEYYNYMTSCYRRICCADLGYAFANKYTLNQCYNHFHKYGSKLQPGDTSYNRSGGACYFDNGIVYIDDGGDCYWNPLEYMLPHVITGTTRTINFYNNPRKMYLNNFRINATMTNRGNLTETPERVPDANGLVWCNGSYWYLYTYGGSLTKDLDSKCICPDKIIKIQAGSSITVSWQLKSNVTTLAGTTPAIQYYAIFFDWTTAMDNPASHYVSSLTVTNHSSQTDKSSGTTITAPSSSTGYVGFALYLRTTSDCTLSYGLFESITVTITPPA